MKFFKIDFEWAVILLCAAAYLINIYLSTGIFDLSDGLAHFAIARYAPQHPELFLDHWGKPVFTLLAAPFAQFGIKGIMVMNTILFVFTARFTVLTAHQLGVRQTWAAPLLIALAPAYYYTTMGGLTEVLFAFVFSAGLFFLSKEKYLASAIFISFLLFVRNEAYAIWPLFMLVFLGKRQWLAAALLFIGPLLYGIAGYFLLNNFWWFITDNPNVGAKEIYGHGTWNYFFQTFDISTGVWLGWSALGGVALAIFMSVKNWRAKHSATLFVASVSVLAVLFVHSYAWWQGLLGSLGLVRVLATVLPAMVLLVLYFFSKLEDSTYLKPTFSLVVILLVIYGTWGDLYALQSWDIGRFPKQADPREKVIQELAEWRKNSSHKNNQNIWYMHPAVGYYLEVDNFSRLDSRQFWYLNKLKPSNSIREGGLLIYDGKHAPNEGNVTKEDLFADPDLVLVKSFRPSEELVELNGFPFELLVFEKRLKPNGDILLFEDFTPTRPLLEGRLNRIATDTAGRRYFDLLTFTHYMHVFTFWKVDSATWQAPKFEFWYRASEPLQVYLSVVHADGTEDDIKWQDGIFELPKFEDDVVNISVSLRNPHPETAVRVYEWGVKKVLF